VKSLIVILGPTGIGKTALSLILAKQFQTSILSADSRQVYQMLNIGTAKPSQEQLASVKHYFIDHITPDSVYSAGQFALDAKDILNDLFLRHEQVVLCGGTGLYIKALLDGLDDFPEIDPEVRKGLSDLYASIGIGALQDELSVLDPSYYGLVDRNNPHRLIRALSVIKSSGKPYSSFLNKSVKELRNYKVIEIHLGMARSDLYQRIEMRVDKMLDSGLLQEVKSLIQYKDSPGMNTVGYKEIIEYMSGHYNLEQAIDKIKQHTRNYAKRQITWFNKYSSTDRFHPEDFEGIQDYVEQSLLSD